MAEERRAQYLHEIIELELSMFLAVKNEEGISECQEHPESFRVMREMTHGVLSNAFLESYLKDLKCAEAAGRNLMTEKYALMASKIPGLHNTPMVREIVVIEGSWRTEVAKCFPRSVHPEGHQSFCQYFNSELQTYSDATLSAYSDCIEAALQQGRNLVHNAMRY